MPSRSFSTPVTRLSNHGVDRYRRPSRKSLAQELRERKEREAYAQRQVNDLWRTLPKRADKTRRRRREPALPEEPQENLLYFIEKNAPLLEPWQREIVRIVRKVAQYFYPQRQSQLMNEGWATFWHYKHSQPDVRRRLPHRRRDDGVAEVAHQRDLPAAGAGTRPTAASTRMRSASRCTTT